MFSNTLLAVQVLVVNGHQDRFRKQKSLPICVVSIPKQSELQAVYGTDLQQEV